MQEGLGCVIIKSLSNNHGTGGDHRYHPIFAIATGRYSANSNKKVAKCYSYYLCGSGETLNWFLWHSNSGVEPFERAHAVQNLTTGTAYQRIATVESLCNQRLATIPGSLFQLVSNDPYVRVFIKTYFIQGQECIHFDEAMEVSEENLSWDKLNVLWVTIEMWPQLDGFSEY